jgi:thiosulfate dehydrogenase
MKIVVLLVTLVSACSGEANVVHQSAVERGARLFETNVSGVSCATCHATAVTVPDSRLLPGAPLAGVTMRSSYWGGQEKDLLSAVNSCRASFQVTSIPLAASDADAADLYAYLDSLPGGADPVAFTVVTSVSDLPEGDVVHGWKVFSAACATCHGELGSGKGRIDDEVPDLPGDVLDEHREFTKEDRRVIFVEKVRHGGFLGYGGHMPPFSVEVLSDERFSDLLAALSLY